MTQTQTERKHAPLPWRVEYHKSHLCGNFKSIVDADGKRVCDRNDAEFKICACNSHYKLVDALRDTQRELNDFLSAILDMGIGDMFVDDATNMPSQARSACEKARAALADIAD